MVKNKTKKDKKKVNDRKKKFKKTTPDLLVVREDDLREVVTETVTKLLAEDVLDMDEDGVIDLKENVQEKKKSKKKSSSS